MASQNAYIVTSRTGLALLSHASIPVTNWSYALPSAVYLINRLPTLTLSNSNPYEKLFILAPNYLKLKVFSCLCYPWPRPYTNHKLDNRSTPCIFLGYSISQCAFLCLDPTSHCLYVSRHVQFVETQFPFKKLSSPAPKISPVLSTEISVPFTVISTQSLPPPSAVQPPGSDISPETTVLAFEPTTNQSQNTSSSDTTQQANTEPEITYAVQSNTPFHLCCSLMIQMFLLHLMEVM